MGKLSVISYQNGREPSLKSSSVEFGTVSSSRGSMSSDDKNISKSLHLQVHKENKHGVRRKRKKRRAPRNVYKNKKCSTSRVEQSPNFNSSVTYISPWGNNLSLSLCLSTSIESVHDSSFGEEPNGHVESVYGRADLLSTSLPKSLIFQINPTLPDQASIAFSDKSQYYKIKEYNHYTHQSEMLSCSSSRDQANSSEIHKLTSNYIRNSQIPASICGSPPSTITSSNDGSYSQPLSFHITHNSPKECFAILDRGCNGTISQIINQPYAYPTPTFCIDSTETKNQMTSLPTTSHRTPKDQCDFEESCISPKSNIAEVGSLDNFPKDISSSSSASESSSLSESSQILSEPISYTPPNSWASASSTESWDSEDGTESINQSFLCLLDSDHFPFKENLNDLKPISEENGQNTTVLKNDNPSKLSTFPVEKQHPSRLQLDVSPSSTSTSSSPENKLIENVIENIGPSSPYSAMQCHRPIIKSSNNSRVAKVFLDENDRIYATLENNSSMRSLYLEEPLSQHFGEYLGTLNSPNSPAILQEMQSTENTIESLGKSLASLVVKCSQSTTEALEILTPIAEPKSDQNVHSRNKTKKRSKLISCFTACLRPSSPRKGQI